MLGLQVAYQEDISFYTPDSCTSFCASSICLTSLEGAKVTPHNLPKVDKFVTYITAKPICYVSKVSGYYSYVTFQKFCECRAGKGADT